VNKLKAKFTITTPMFLSGSNQKLAELRAASLKGAIRFWWRALQAQKDIKTLKEKENRLFGSTEQQASVQIYLTDINIKTKEQNRWKPNQWEAYAGYGLIETTNTDKREFIVPKSSFTLNLVSKTEIDQSVKNAVIALGLLGGLGGRTRKGWGSLTLESFNGWSKPEDIESFNKAILDLNLPVAKNLPKYTAFSDETAIVFGKIKDSNVAAHRFLAEKYKESINNSWPKSEREQFGLPRANNNKRRASPLFLHVHSLSSGKAIPIVSFLPAQFLPSQPQPDGNYKHIQAFLNEVSK